MPWWGILILIITIVACGCGIYLVIVRTINNKQLLIQKKQLQVDIIDLQQQIQNGQDMLDIYKEEYLTIQNNVDILSAQKNALFENVQDLSKIKEETETNLKQFILKGFEQYCDILENEIIKKEEEYDNAEERLKSAYDLAQQKVINELHSEEEQLQRVRNTRAAAIEAQKREQEIKERLSFYCLKLTTAELSDVKKLEELKPQLNNSRILSMLIWSTYFQKQMTNLCNNILGLSTVCGIYKITNQTNNMCYVGQSVNIAERWKQHAKCGLGIDTPIGNKLYRAMIQDGIWNFSFELLEKCPKEQLNEKEKYYIDLYQSSSYGYNSTIGVG